MRLSKSLRTLVAVGLATGCALGVGKADAGQIVIHAGELLDGTMAPPRKSVSIVIEGERIVAIQDGFINPAGAAVIDLSQQTVLPGLIEAHDHLGFSNDLYDLPNRRATKGDAVIDVIRNAYAEIESGFTSTRDCGTYNVDLKSVQYAIARGRLVGPRIWTALEPLGPVGGHSDPENQFEAPTATAEEREHALVRGPIDAREKVREHFARGANLIKIMPSGGVSSLDDDPHQLTMSFEEIKAVVEAAHALGLKVAAHAHGLEAVNASIQAGVDSIEHGTFADEHAFKEMKARGIFLDPTITVSYLKFEMGKAHPEHFDPRVLAKGMKAWPLAIDAAATAHRLGVKIAMGTDQSSLGTGQNKAVGIARLVQAGLSPQEALVAATGSNAELIGSQDIGVIAVGRFADIIAVSSDPLKQIDVLQHVRFVMKGGEIFKRDGVMIGGKP